LNGSASYRLLNARLKIPRRLRQFPNTLSDFANVFFIPVSASLNYDLPVIGSKVSFLNSLLEDLPLILNQYDFNKYDFDSRLMTVDGVYTRCCIKSMKQHMVRQLIAPL